MRLHSKLQTMFSQRLSSKNGLTHGSNMRSLTHLDSDTSIAGVSTKSQQNLSKT